MIIDGIMDELGRQLSGVPEQLKITPNDQEGGGKMISRNCEANHGRRVAVDESIQTIKVDS